MTWPAQPVPPGSVVLGWRLEPRVGPFIWWWAGQNRRFGMVLVPLWIPVLAASGSAGLLWRSAIRDRRRWLVGHCASCGYDQQGLAAGAACPECGAGKAA